MEEDASSRRTELEGVRERALEMSHAVEFWREELEGSPVDVLAVELVPLVERQVGGALEALNRLVSLDPRHPETGGPLAVVDDAHIARWELQENVSSLVLAAARGRWELLDACAKALRRVSTIGRALEKRLSAVLGVPSESTKYESVELERALALRREYCAFRDDANRLLARSELTTERRLRLVAVQIAKLLNGRIGAYVRVRDRVMFRGLQARIRDWLLGARRGGYSSDLAGERLVQDVAASVTLLRGINNRPELRDHDRAAIARSLTMLTGCVSMGTSETSLLESLRGRDDDLDRSIADGHGLVVVRRHLGRLAQALQSPTPPSGPTDGDAAAVSKKGIPTP